jgi:uncharacterized protein YjbI with pentapeptide repeats
MSQDKSVAVGLDTSDEDDVVREHEAARDVARARTLVALLAVGPERNRDVVRFLYEAELIKTPNAIVDLKQANLTDADLKKMPLSGIDLSGANLSDGVDENQRGAILRKADLQGAKLDGAKLNSADLEGAVLQDASLKGTNLKGTNLKDAMLKDGATGDTNNALLDEQGAHLEDATMPTGQKYEDWLKVKEGRGEDGEG